MTFTVNKLHCGVLNGNPLDLMQQHSSGVTVTDRSCFSGQTAAKFYPAWMRVILWKLYFVCIMHLMGQFIWMEVLTGPAPEGHSPDERSIINSNLFKLQSPW